MGFRCIACNNNRSTSHIMKDAKSGDLILIACCLNCGLGQLKDVPNELDLLIFISRNTGLSAKRRIDLVRNMFTDRERRRYIG